MISDTTSRKAFSPEVPGLQFAFESVSHGLLKECPRKYQYTILEGWIPALESVHLTFGLHYHKAIEIYDHKRAADLSPEWFSMFNPDNQMSLYTLASQIVYEQPVKGVIISGAQILVNFTRFQRGFTTRHREELDEWLEEAGWYIKLGEAYARKSFWPKNDKACGHYGGCSFRSICSSAPAMRDTLLQA